jgi:hypothetical protein
VDISKISQQKMTVPELVEELQYVSYYIHIHNSVPDWRNFAALLKGHILHGIPLMSAGTWVFSHV